MNYGLFLGVDGKHVCQRTRLCSTRCDQKGVCVSEPYCTRHIRDPFDKKMCETVSSTELMGCFLEPSCGGSVLGMTERCPDKSRCPDGCVPARYLPVYPSVDAGNRVCYTGNDDPCGLVGTGCPDRCYNKVCCPFSFPKN
jgi:hypothetical protein